MNDVETESVDEKECCGLSFPKVGQTEIGWLFIGGAAIGGLLSLLKRDRDVTDWVLPLSLVGVGCSVLLKGRQGEIEAAEQTILSELDRLDPIARAQVLKSVAAEEVSRLPGLGQSDD